MSYSSYDALNFINDHWVDISLTWNGSSDNYYIDSHDMSYLRKGIIPVGRNWSCFFAADLMLSVYNLPNLHDRYYTKVYDIENFIADFEPGHLYKFNITDHTFTVIYDYDGKIYYVDYYMETERRTQGFDEDECDSNYFRMEQLTSNIIFEYLNSYLNEDFDEFAKFNKGSENYKKEYIKSYYEAKAIINDNINFYILEYYKHTINFIPTICSVVNTVISNPPSESLINESIDIINSETDLKVDTCYMHNMHNWIIEHLKSYCNN